MDEVSHLDLGAKDLPASKRYLNYEATLDIAGLLQETQLKLVKKTARYYHLKKFNEGTRRTR